jgi:hypothetical protein
MASHDPLGHMGGYASWDGVGGGNKVTDFVKDHKKAMVLMLISALVVTIVVLVVLLVTANDTSDRMTSGANLLDTSASSSSGNTLLSASNQGNGTNVKHWVSPEYTTEAAAVAAAQLENSKQAFRSRSGFFNGRASGPSPRYVPPFEPEPASASGTERMSDARLTSTLHGHQ